MNMEKALKRAKVDLSWLLDKSQGKIKQALRKSPDKHVILNLALDIRETGPNQYELKAKNSFVLDRFSISTATVKVDELQNGLFNGHAEPGPAQEPVGLPDPGGQAVPTRRSRRAASKKTRPKTASKTPKAKRARRKP